MEVLPFEVVGHYKWLCYRASEAATFVGRGESQEAGVAFVAGWLHGVSIDRLDCPCLSADVRNILQQLAWLAVPARYGNAAKEQYSEQCGQLKQCKSLAPTLREYLIEMAQAAADWFALVRLHPPSSDCVPEWHALVRFVYASWRCYWRQPPWRGANLGGWLLLEPGPSCDLWERARKETKSHRDEGEVDGDHDEDASGIDDIEDEHGLCDYLDTKAAAIIDEHRKTWLSESDFTWLAERGFNSIRVPFGYWVVTGPTFEDSYIGPAIQYLDHVVDLAERFNFQVILDLHGNPGGESAEAPCGCKWEDWDEQCWRRDEALEVLSQVARRYANRQCVCGLQVANEPSQRCDITSLCDWYERAIEIIRKSGMSADRVAIVLPVYWYDRLEEFLRVWVPRGNFMRFDNIALDFHFYQCFGAGWEFLEHREHIRVAHRHGDILRSLPNAVVGEWSLARPAHVLATDEMELEFADAQLSAYASASHGWFFWTYKDGAEHWDLGTCFERGWLQKGLSSKDQSNVDNHDLKLARTQAPGRFPLCYGEGLFSKLKKQSRDPDAAALDDLRSRAARMAEATGASCGEAVEVLSACGGNSEAAMAKLLRLASAQHLVDMFACSRDAAIAALETEGGSVDRAACHLLEKGSAPEDAALRVQNPEEMRGRKREREDG